MPASLTDAQVRELEAMLRSRLQTLTDETRRLLVEYDEARYGHLAGEVHDIGEQSVADLLVDLELADVDRHIEEIRDIEAALLRIAGRAYGICIDCEGPVDYERLSVYPTAKRCVRCQERHEKSHAGPGRPSF
ncbi:conjugal transfer protein TraR [Thioalkalivibrio denitrificans]|uniref:Conjugal transfer protein TraR n=1 Tax=Thioalkalivibrio denitrificans TaxID=108003 RepID=A0A1V3NIM5_9GAMM|nr:TraR/DksA family transcriptional regulator [Thioalkalivibrio denitrificans]OOG24738.1 conjugal transfer protein TraR [Thioalkalivibrio denitrificans]